MAEPPGSGGWAETMLQLLAAAGPGGMAAALAIVVLVVLAVTPR